MVVTQNEPWEHLIPLAEAVDITRVMATIEELATISTTSAETEGVTRLGYSESDIKAKNRIIELMKEAGLDVRVSPIGNIFGRLAPKLNRRPVVLTGSHSDSVVRGGRYDGIVGLVAAIEATRVLNSIKDELFYPVEVADFTMEESSRFGGDYGFGSSVMMGEIIQESWLLRTDKNGVSLASALQNMKHLTYYPQSRHAPTEILANAYDLIERSRRPASEIRAYVEMHIEQSVILEQEGISIGAVTGAATPTRWEITLTGEQAHSGTSLMYMRRNPLLAAAEIVLLVDKLCKEQESAGKGTVGAITKIQVEPNVQNIVPGKCILLLDLRGPDQVYKEEVLSLLNKEIKGDAQENLDSLEKRYGVECTITEIANERPITFSPTICDAVERSCAALGVNSMRVHSRAGHDACHIAKLVKECGMIFLPSRNGVSHNKDEYTSESDILNGTKTLLLTLMQLALG